MEKWKSIKGFEGMYEISNKGRARSIDREVKQRDDSIQIKKGLVLKLAENHKGYPMVNFSKNNKKYYKSVHRLVALAFIKNPHKKRQVNHIDGNKKNNNVDNLEWVTAKENIQHALANGLMKIDLERLNKAKEKAIIANKKPVKQYSLEGEFISKYNSLLEAQKETGVKAKGISEVLRKRQKTSGGYIWKYATNEKS